MAIGKRRRISDRSSGDMALIASGCRVDGDIVSDGDLLVLGKVSGHGRIVGTVTIADGGVWEGDLEAGYLIVAGRTEGSLSASERIEICETARIRGTVSGAAIAVGQGAVIDGELHTVDGGPATEFVEQRERARDAAD